jgi:hypothetical protein
MVHIQKYFLNSSIFWDITSCSLLKINRWFGGKCSLHLQGWRLSQPRRQHEVGSVISHSHSYKNLKSYESNFWSRNEVCISIICARNVPICNKRTWKQIGYTLHRIKKDAFGKYWLFSSSEINCHRKQNICYIQFKTIFYFTCHESEFCF